MKKILIVLLALMPAAVFAQSSSLQSFFDKYAGQDGFTTVKISPKLFELVASVEVDDQDLSVLKDLTGVNVLVWENEEGKDDAKAIQLKNEAYESVNKDYDELMTVREGETDLKILAKSAGDGVISDLLIVGYDDGEFIFVSVTGKIDIKKLSSLADDVDIDGMEHLKDLDKDSEQK